MSLRDQLKADLKQAMRDQDTMRRNVIRRVQTTLNEREQENKEHLTKKALEKHHVQRPSNQKDEDMVRAYEQAVDAAIAAERVEEASKLDETEILSLIQKLVKQQQDTIDEAKSASRTDIVEENEAELEILLAYLPKQLSREEIEAEVRAQIAAVGAVGAADMGKVMGPLMAKLKGKADGKLISAVVKELLT